MDGYFDEEELLGFPVWAAELEYLLGSKKHTSEGLDQVQLYELLQKMLMSLDHTEKDQIKRHQEGVMVLVTNALTEGVPSAIRRLMVALLARLLETGGSVHTTSGAFVQFLSIKEAKTLSDSAIMGALEALGRIGLVCARSSPSLVQGIMEAVARYAKGFSSKVRTTALHAISALVLGLGYESRDAANIQDMALKAAEKGYGSKREIVRYASAAVIGSVGRSGGAGFWNGWVGSCVKMCTTGLQDPSDRTRAAFAQALGELAACPYHPMAKDLVDQQPDENKKQKLAKQMTELVKTSLLDSMTRAIAEQDDLMMSAVAQAWLTFLAAIKTRYNVGDSVLAELGMSLVGALGEAKGPKSAKKEDPRHVEFPHAQACLVYIIKFGVIDQMSESGQRYLLENLGSLLATEQQENLKDQRMVQTVAPACQHLLVLQTMELLLELLEEVPTDSRQSLEGPVTELLLRTPNPSVRDQCGLTLARMAMADRAQAPFILSKAIEELRHAADRLSQVASRLRAESESILNKIQTFGITVIKDRELDTVRPLKGEVDARASTLAAMVCSLRHLPLGLSSQLYRDVLKLVEHLVSRPISAKDPPDISRLATNVLREAGYLVGAALLASVSWSGVGRAGEATPLYLWRAAATPDSAKLFESTIKSFVMIPLGPGSSSSDLVLSELRWRANALEALGAWVTGPHASKSDQEASLIFTVPMLQMVLNLMPQFTMLQDPDSQKSKDPELFRAAVRFQIALLEAFQGLPDPAKYQDCYPKLTQIIWFRWMSPPLDPAMSIHRLRDILDRADDVLGPWTPGRDPMGDQLRRFRGERQGILPRPWARESLTVRLSEPVGYEEQLLEAQINLAARIFPYVAEKEQLQWIDKIGSHVGSVGREKSAARRAEVLSTVCYCLIQFLRSISARLKSGQASSQLAAKCALVASMIAQASDDNAAVLRGAAEAMAYAARIGTEQQALSVVNDAVNRLLACYAPHDKKRGERFDLPRPFKAYLAFVIGCVYRRCSGMSLLSELMGSVRCLVDVTKKLYPDPEATGKEATSQSAPHLWTLHAICLAATNAGPSYIPLVFTTLSLGYQLLLSDAHNCPGMTAAVARIANASIAALGPELAPGSPEYNYTKALIREIDLPVAAPVIPGVILEVDGAVGVACPAPGESSGGEGTSSSLETVLYAQQLVLFAPQAVPPSKHLHMLCKKLRSGQPYLRRAAAKMLRLIAERDPHCVMEQSVELTLFAALDLETEPGIGIMLKDTLAAMLQEGALVHPSKWLIILGEVALGTPVVEVLSRVDFREGEDAASDDDEGPTEVETALAKKELHTAPQLRTRVFASDLMLDLFGLFGCLTRDRVREILTSSLQDMVNLGYKLVTGNVEGLRTFGLQFLLEVVGRFGAVEDPDYPGHSLLEQYQAQLVSSLRYGLSADYNPVLMALGARLTTAFLEFGLAGGDLAVVSRLMTMLIAPIKNWTRLVEERMQAEALSALLKVSLLQTHASCAHFVALREAAASAPIPASAAGMSEKDREAAAAKAAAEVSAVSQAQQPHESKLLELWLGLMSDLAAVLALPEAALGSYNPSLFSIPAPAILLGIEPFLEAAVPTILDGTVVVLRRKASKLTAQPEPKALASLVSDSARVLDVCRLLLCYSSGIDERTAAGQEAPAVSQTNVRGANLLVRSGFASTQTRGLLTSTVLRSLASLVGPDMLVKRVVSSSQALDALSLIRDCMEANCERAELARGTAKWEELADMAKRVISIASDGLASLCSPASLDAVARSAGGREGLQDGPAGPSNPASPRPDMPGEAEVASILAAAVCSAIVAASRFGVVDVIPSLVRSAASLLRRPLSDTSASRLRPRLLLALSDLIRTGPDTPDVLASLEAALCTSMEGLCEDLSRAFLRKVTEGPGMEIGASLSGTEAVIAATVVTLVEAAREEAASRSAPPCSVANLTSDAVSGTTRLSAITSVLAATSLAASTAAADLRSYQSMALDTSFADFGGGDGGFGAFGEEPNGEQQQKNGKEQQPESESARQGVVLDRLARLQLEDLKPAEVLEGARLMCVGALVSLIDPAAAAGSTPNGTQGKKVNGANGASHAAQPLPEFKDPGWVQATAIRCLRAALPGVPTDGTVEPPQRVRARGVWAADLWGTYLAHVAHAVHRTASAPSQKPLAQWAAVLIAEAARLAHAAVAGLPDQHSNALRMVQVVVPLLVSAAAPRSRPYSGPLLDAIVRSLTRLAKEHPDMFRQAIDSMSTDAKQALQSVLRAAATGQAPTHMQAAGSATGLRGLVPAPGASHTVPIARKLAPPPGGGLAVPLPLKKH